MKIAGRKNQSAWFRTNEFIKAANTGAGQDGVDPAAIQTKIEGLDTFAPYLAALEEIATQTGTISPGANIAATYATKGIPLQVWEGRFSFDTYTRTEENGKVTYPPDHPDEARKFGADLRDMFKKMMFAARMMGDVANVDRAAQGNPGGVADATKDPVNP